jgi:hypothetical protein
VFTLKGRERKRAEWGAARQAFLVLATEILVDLDRLGPRTKVYEKFKDRLGMSYSQFCYWVRRYRQEGTQAAKAASFDGPAAHAMPAQVIGAPAAPSGDHKPLYLGPSGQRTFHYDPLDAYRKKYD